jgi:hypothetical protein
MRRHPAHEFRGFLDEVERNVPADIDIHVVVDDYGNPKTQLIRNRFARRPRWHLHFTPRSASSINRVGSFFTLLADRAARRGPPQTVAEPEAAITAANTDPRPFV